MSTAAAKPQPILTDALRNKALQSVFSAWPAARENGNARALAIELYFKATSAKRKE